jgi:predicted transcriptional regulator
MNPIRHIRVAVFKVTQAEFAEIAETAQATVSRWEKETLQPDLLQLRRIRTEARRRQLRWTDSLFFEDPAATQQKGRSAA